MYLVNDCTSFLLYGRNDFEKMTEETFDYAAGVNGHYEITLQIDTFADVDTLYKKVVSRGSVPILPPTTEPWGQRICYVADTEGNLIEIGSFSK